MKNLYASVQDENMTLFREVLLNSEIMPTVRTNKKAKVTTKKRKPSDFFYQLISVDTVPRELSLKDLLCISEIGIIEGDFQKEAGVFAALGDKYEELKKGLSATKFHKKALRSYSKLNDFVGKSLSFNKLGISYYNRGNFIKAKEMHSKFKKLCTRDFIPSYNLGIICRALKKYKESEKNFLRALKISHEKCNKEESCISLAQLGLTYKALNELDLANYYLSQALNLAKMLRSDEILIEIKITLAYLSFHRGDINASESHFFTSMLKSLGVKSDICRINVGIIRGEALLTSLYPDYRPLSSICNN